LRTDEAIRSRQVCMFLLQRTALEIHLRKEKYRRRDKLLDLMVDFNKTWTKNALVVTISRKNFVNNEQP
jgi:hypothetical protein